MATTLYGVYLAARFPLRSQVRLIAVAMIIVLGLSLAFGVALPGYGRMSGEHAGAWRGVFVHKNSLGRFSTFAAPLLLIISLGARRHGWIPGLGAALALALMLLSSSKTALLVTVVTGLFWLLAASLRTRWQLMLPTVMLISVVGLGAVVGGLVFSDQLFALVGRDATLTGRTLLWSKVMVAISHEPALGYGYLAFWKGHAGPSAWLLRAVGWDVPHSHNGFLDLSLDVGYVGLILFSFSWILALIRTLRCLRVNHTPYALWPFLTVTLLFAWNLSESTLLRPNSIFWVLYVAAICSSARLLRESVGAQRSHLSRPAPLPVRNLHHRAGG